MATIMLHLVSPFNWFMLHFLNVKVKNHAFDTSKMITNVFYEELAQFGKLYFYTIFIYISPLSIRLWVLFAEKMYYSVVISNYSVLFGISRYYSVLRATPCIPNVCMWDYLEVTRLVSSGQSSFLPHKDQKNANICVNNNDW